VLSAATSRRSYIVGENPMLSDPDIKHVGEAFENLEFLVVQDIFMTETAERRRCGTAFGFFRGEGRHLYKHRKKVQRVRKAVSAPAMPSRP